MLNTVLAIVVDSSGDLEAWYDAPDLWAIGGRWLAPRFIHVGRPLETRDRDRLWSIAATATGEMDKTVLTAAVVDALRALTNAQMTADAVRSGVRVAERTTIVVVVRTGDPLCDHLSSILNELHRAIATRFPTLNTHVALTLLLPSLFRDSTDVELARTYALLRWVDVYADDSSAVRLYPGPKRPLQSVWLANSINEEGLAIGQFPAAVESLTGFLQALALGAVTLSDGADHVHGAVRRCYATFGCSVLAAEQEELSTAAATSLFSTLVPRLFGVEGGSRDIAAREAQRFVSASGIDRLESLLALDVDGAPLVDMKRLSWSADTAKQTATVLADLAKTRSELDRVRQDALLKLERRHQALEIELGDALRAAAGERANSDGCQAVEWFLESLVADPPEDEDLFGADDRLSFFGLLGRAIDRLDSLIGFTEPRQRLARLEERLRALEEQRRTLDVESTLLEERISSARLHGAQTAGDEPPLDALESKLDACRTAMLTVVAEARGIRAQYRGQLIADRSFHMGLRQGAVATRRRALESAVSENVERYTQTVARFRETAVHLGELYVSRRSWLLRTIVAVPGLTGLALGLLQMALPLTPWVRFTDLVTFYNEQSADAAAAGGVLIFVYAVVKAWRYWRRFAVPLRTMESELQRQGNLVSIAAEDCAKADRDVVEFLLQVAQRDATIRLLTRLREYGRDELLQRARTFREWVGRPLTWAPKPRTLYRTPVWEPDQVGRLQGQVLEGMNVESVFWATTGERSSWVFLTPAEARARLNAFADEQFKRLSELTAEDMLFHPKFGLDRRNAENLVLAVDVAAAPYLRLHETDGTFSERIVLTAGGRHSQVRELLERNQMTAVYPEFADPSRLVVVRTRQGFPLRSLVELRTFWHASLANPTLGLTGSTRYGSDLLDLPDVEPYNQIASAFLLLLANGRIAQGDGGYLLDGRRLCEDRLRFYAECVSDPDRRDDEARVLAAAAALDTAAASAAVDGLLENADLSGWERDVISKAVNADAI